MKLPLRLALALGTLITGLLALTGELALSHPVHQLLVLTGSILLFLLQPTTTTTPATPATTEKEPL